MNFIAPWINAMAIMLGGGVGSMAGDGKLSKTKFRSYMIPVCGLVIMGLGVMGILDSFFILDEVTEAGKAVKVPEAEGTLLMVMSLLVGWMFGKAFGVDHAIRSGGKWLYRKFVAAQNNAGSKKGNATAGKTKQTGQAVSNVGDSERFVEGFLITVVVTCACSMTIFGAAEGTGGNTLYIKAAVDVVLTAALAMVYGVGVAFAAIAVLLLELIWTMMQSFGDGFLTSEMARQIAFVGSCAVAATGFNLAFGKKFKVGNLLPALAMPVLYYSILMITEQITGIKIGK